MIAIAALALALLELLFLIGVAAVVVRAGRKLGPQIRPLLAMFAPPPLPPED